MAKDKNARMHKQRFDNVAAISKEEVKGPESLFQLVRP